MALKQLCGPSGAREEHKGQRRLSPRCPPPLCNITVSPEVAVAPISAELRIGAMGSGFL